MTEVVERARKARSNARAARIGSLLTAASAHERSASIARRFGAATTDAGPRRVDADRAREHELSAQVLRRRARWLTNLRLMDVKVIVHLSFHDASCRDDVLMLLRELGPWEGGELIDVPGQGAYFRIMSDDLIMCEIAVRERLRFALAPLEGWEQLVTLYAVWPHS